MVAPALRLVALASFLSLTQAHFLGIEYRPSYVSQWPPGKGSLEEPEGVGGVILFRHKGVIVETSLLPLPSSLLSPPSRGLCKLSLLSGVR